MKETKKIGPLYYGETYIVLGDDVVRLNVHADGDYRFKSETIIKKENLSQLIKAASAETADELIEIIPECADIPRWLDLVKEFKNSITGKVVTGLWKSWNEFVTDNETLEVMPSSGVYDLLEKFKNAFPRRCKVIIMDEIYSDGKTSKVIPWTFTY